MRNCTRDEGGPFEVGEASNYALEGAALALRSDSSPPATQPLDDVRADDLLLHELELPWGAVADVVIGELTLSLRDARVVALSARTVPPRRYHTESCAAKHFNQKRGPAVAYALRSAWFEAMPSLVR